MGVQCPPCMMCEHGNLTIYGLRTCDAGVMLLHSLHHVRCLPCGTFAFRASCGGVFNVGQKQLQRFLLITSFVGKLTPHPFQKWHSHLSWCCHY
jgi:hypothetical protein